MSFFAFLALVMLVFVNGWTDAPNAITCPVVTGCMSKRQALVLAGVMNLLGCTLTTAVGGKVASFTFSIADFGNDKDSLTALGIGIGAVVLWSVIAWIFGIPTSESHGMLASLSGAAIALAICNYRSPGDAINGRAWLVVLIGLVFSTVPSYALAGLIFALIGRVEKALAKKRRRMGDRLYTVAQNFGAGATAFMHGAEDGQKFVGIFLMIFAASGRRSGGERGIIIAAITVACLMTLGTLCGGGRIIEHTGKDMVYLDKRGGFCADLSASAILVICLLLGIPVSTTHAKTCAIMGAGRELDRGVVCEMVSAWLLTFPVCFVLGFVCTFAACGGFF